MVDVEFFAEIPDFELTLHPMNPSNPVVDPRQNIHAPSGEWDAKNALAGQSMRWQTLKWCLRRRLVRKFFRGNLREVGSPLERGKKNPENL